MAIRKTRTRRRETFEYADHDYLITVLASGHDFFSELPTDEKTRLDLLRRAWADDEIRQGVYEQCRKTNKQPWAEITFGK
jgi:hypothetical protein